MTNLEYFMMELELLIDQYKNEDKKAIADILKDAIYDLEGK